MSDKLLFLVIFFVLLSLILILFLFKEKRKSTFLNKECSNHKKDKYNLNSIDKQKTNFIAFTSHKLRGPSSTINGYISMITEGDYGEIPKNLKDPLDKIKTSGAELSDLINEFLDISMIERDEIKYNLEEINLIKKIEEVVNSTEQRFEEEKLNLITTYDTSDKLLIKTDGKRLGQVLNNILDNSLRYTPAGNVTLSILENKDNITITIKDTGIGLEKDKVDQIFNKFYRTEEARKIHVNGNGLGLYTCKEIIEDFGGKIWATSQGIGKGTNFHILLPYKQNK